MTDETNIPQKNISGNWVKIKRDLYRGYLKGDGTAIAIFLYIIGDAQRFRKVTGKITYEVGTYYRGISSIIEHTGFKKRAVWRVIDKLEEHGAVVTLRGHRGTQITICKYKEYQLSDLTIGDTECTPEAPPEAPPGGMNKRKKDPEDQKKERKKEKGNLILSGGVTPGTLVWTAYCSSYKQRYGTDPTRNAKSNALCAQMVKRVGEDAAAVIGFYVTHNDRWYVQKCHALEYAVKDAEKLHMEWKRGCQMTSTLAKTVEFQSNNDAVFAAYLKGKK